ncbi:hypothetical protein BT246_22150 [Bacillus thuringiensis]|uniref:HTH cro/C1-type domain-containing protein n=1 Tax=Bacillus thuringiensis TaxID=1428 RepID=A0A9W3SA97_BACTU|nr:helix-turn-helix transcriptional regulator [Bacillus thuringiensis]ANS47589.1 hypothetical protein BT246_22150 [Bacillus thuringiensis]
MSITSDRIKQSRKEKKLTMDELAKAMNVAQSAIVRWENGTTIPKQDKLKRLSHLLSVDYEYLLGLQNEPRKPTFKTVSRTAFSNLIQNLKRAFEDKDEAKFSSIISKLEENHAELTDSNRNARLSVNNRIESDQLMKFNDWDKENKKELSTLVATLSHHDKETKSAIIESAQIIADKFPQSK